jgi:putative salt-induced outer membrane protein YdiY
MLSSRTAPILLALFLAGKSVLAADEPWAEGFEPPPGEYSWVQLDTGEWLKGEITSLYDDVLVFDSDHFDDLQIDLEDIEQILAVGEFHVTIGDAIRGDRQIVSGQLAMSGETVVVTREGGPREFRREDLVAITQMAEREIDRWNGDLTLGWNVRQGNSEITDFSLSAGFRRRTPISRLSLDYLGNQNTTDGVRITDSHRANLAVDRFTSTRFYWRPISAQYYKDELQNIKHQATVDSGIGYHVIDTPRTSWELQAGVGGNYLENVSVAPGEPNGEWSPVATFGSDFEYELTSWMDYELYIDLVFLEDEAGKYQHHIVSNLSTDLVGNLDLDFSVVWDRTARPQTAEDGTVPEKDDYRFVVSLAYDF